MSRSGRISAKPLSVLLSDVFSDTYAKQGFAARELVTRWAEIAGADVACVSRTAGKSESVGREAAEAADGVFERHQAFFSHVTAEQSGEVAVGAGMGR